MKKIVPYIVTIAIILVSPIVHAHQVCQIASLPRLFSSKENDDKKDMAAAYINYTTVSLARIEKLNNRIVFQQEYDYLKNNLSDEAYKGFEEVASTHNILLDNLNVLIINDKERELVQKWASEELSDAILSSADAALSQPWISTNIYSTIVTAAKTAAHAAIDYKLTKNKINRQLEKDLWAIEKGDLNTINKYLSDVKDMKSTLVEKKDLNDDMILGQKDAEKLVDATIIDNASLRLRTLLELPKNVSKQESVNNYAPYWYYLGDAYFRAAESLPKNSKDYQAYRNKGLENYEHYIAMMKHTPIFRTDPYMGQIYLDLLDYKNLSKNEKLNLIADARRILNDNGPAILLLAMKSYELGEDYNATVMLQNALTSDKIGCKDEMVLALSSYFPRYSSNKQLVSDVIKSIEKVQGLSLLPTLSFMSAYYKTTRSRDILQQIKDISVTADLSSWYNPMTYIRGRSADIRVNYSYGLNMKPETMTAYVIISSTKAMEDILSGTFTVPYAVTASEIKKIPYLKKDIEDNSSVSVNFLFKRISDKDYLFNDEIDLSDAQYSGLPEVLKNNLKDDDKKKLIKWWNNQKSGSSSPKAVAVTRQGVQTKNPSDMLKNICEVNFGKGSAIIIQADGSAECFLKYDLDEDTEKCMLSDLYFYGTHVRLK